MIPFFLWTRAKILGQIEFTLRILHEKQANDSAIVGLGGRIFGLPSIDSPAHYSFCSKRSVMCGCYRLHDFFICKNIPHLVIKHEVDRKKIRVNLLNFIKHHLLLSRFFEGFTKRNKNFMSFQLIFYKQYFWKTWQYAQEIFYYQSSWKKKLNLCRKIKD